jgi:NADH-quinone oxidoreductase subunit J
MAYSIYFVLFAVLSLVELASLMLLYLLKDALHSVLALAVALSASALILLALQQPLIALMQLFITVGGIATYLLAAVASVDTKPSVSANMAALALLSIALFATLCYVTSGTGFTMQQGAVLSVQSIVSSMSANVTLLYTVTLALFCIGIGAIALMRKIG